MTELIQQIQTALFELIELALAGAIFYLLARGRQLLEDFRKRIKMALGERQFNLLQKIAFDAVKYAEQEGLTKELQGVLLTGEQKYNLALEYIQKTLDYAGITSFDASKIDAVIKGAIESAVNTLYRKQAPS